MWSRGLKPVTGSIRQLWWCTTMTSISGAGLLLRCEYLITLDLSFVSCIVVSKELSTYQIRTKTFLKRTGPHVRNLVSRLYIKSEIHWTERGEVSTSESSLHWKQKCSFYALIYDLKTQSKWKEYRSHLEFVYDNLKHWVTGFSPFMLMYGFQSRSPIVVRLEKKKL